MGGLFTTRTSVPITDVNRVRSGHCIAFSIDQCCDIPLGPPVDITANDTIVGKGIVEFLKITRENTQGQIRVLRPENVAPAHLATYPFVHNYILWPDQPFGELRTGAAFQTLKDKQRRFPLGVPIDLAVGKEFRIVASIIVRSLAITDTRTNISGEIILVYSPEESKFLTDINRRREAIRRQLS